MNTNLGNRIKNLRKERHLSQEYVAEQIGVSRQSVSEVGKRRIKTQYR